MPGTCQPGQPCCPQIVPCDQKPCGPNGPCGPAGRFWVAADYLLWTTKGVDVPPLVTTSLPGTPRELAGVLGVGTTTVLAGGDKFGDEWRSGFRVSAGAWLDQCQTCGLEASYFFLQNATRSFSASSSGIPILARPFTDANTTLSDAQLIAFAGLGGTPVSELISFPGVVSGSVSTDERSTFWGADANVRNNLCCACNYRLDFLAGYRFLSLSDDLNVYEDLTSTDPTSTRVPVGTRLQVADNFSTRNQFHGGQVGLAGEFREGRFFVNGEGTIAFGQTFTTVDINGGTAITVPGTPTRVFPGGLLALPTNMGHYTSSDFAVVPQVGLNAGFQLSEHLRAHVGYTFIYWSRVARAADQIDTAINPTQLPPGTLAGVARPAFELHTTDFWAQGINFGVELRY
jgi:hypothetical protein